MNGRLPEADVTRIHQTILRVLDLEVTKSNASFYDYCKRLANRKNLRQYVQHKLDLLALGKCQVQNSVILDVGCGFGITCIVLALLGATQVHGVDIYEPWLRIFETCLFQLNTALPIYPKLGDAAMLDYPSEFFDILISNEAISHYRDVTSFIQEAYRVLRKGGTLLVADGNNQANPLKASQLREIWKRFEEGPPGPVHGHVVGKAPYVIMRSEIIHRRYPRLTDTELSILSKGTFAMNESEILGAVERYLKDGSLPQRFRTENECPLDPEWNAVVERGFDPVQLAEEMCVHGLAAKAYGYFGGASGNRFRRLANRTLMRLSPFTIWMTPSFRIVAVKPE